MAGWTSFSDFINEVVANGKSLTSIFMKSSPNTSDINSPAWAECYSWVGVPGTGPQTGTAGTGTAIAQSVQGTGINIGANVSPDIRSLLTMQAFAGNSNMVPLVCMLVDFLVYWPSCVVTGAPTALTAQPLTRYTDGKGVMPIVAVQTALGANRPAITLTCTFDDASVDVIGALQPYGNNAQKSELFGAGDFQALPFPTLPNGKLGVKSINSYTLSFGTTGTACFFLVKPLAMMPVMANQVAAERDMMMQLPSLPRIYDDAHLGWLVTTYNAIQSSSPFGGMLNFGWG